MGQSTWGTTRGFVEDGCRNKFNVTSTGNHRKWQQFERNRRFNGSTSDRYGNDTTDEESSEYSGLEDDEDEGSILESFDDDDDEDDEDEEDDEDSSSDELAAPATSNDKNPATNDKETPATNEGELSASLALLKPIVDEYEYDSSDEEDLRNTVGNIPMK